MMAQRKDQMRIIRQDAGFSAKLGFGGPVPGQGGDRPLSTAAGFVAAPEATANEQRPKTAAVLEVDEVTSPATDATKLAAKVSLTEKETRKEEGGSSRDGPQSDRLTAMATTPSSSPRGQVVYVAVSLTARQAALAEVWAEAARCPVQLLIRRVAQGLREEVFDDWERGGMPEVMEPRGSRGKHPTSVTLTLQPQFAAGLSARHDPLGIMGLARVMGPAFRARFQMAFDEALAKANIAAVNEGEGK